MQSPTAEEIREQLKKILSSRGFKKNERLCGFLRFVVEQELAEKGDELKESIVGVEVFGRSADYDVPQDSVVRTEASKLRDRLSKYCAAEGAADVWTIDLPKGGYRPAVRAREQPARARLSGRRWIVAALLVSATGQGAGSM